VIDKEQEVNLSAFEKNPLSYIIVAFTQLEDRIDSVDTKQRTMPFEEVSDRQSEAIALMKTRLSGFETEVGRGRGLAYTPKFPDEVAITTTPKAGTTWMQQVSQITGVLLAEPARRRTC
jgi:hypothetical protein